jgi:tetratricopeptide (TPR) repeat protein
MDINLSPPKICLNMIVKNESKIICRALTAVLSVIDTYCICDTGSTDNTIEIIETFFKLHNIPGKIVQEPFKNFEYNRNYAMDCCAGMADYLLLIDADMCPSINKFNKQDLWSYHACFILQGSDNFYYQNIRIVKNINTIRYIGSTHEYINLPSESKIQNVRKDDFFILDYGDGGCKQDKYTRDIALLTETLKTKPNDERSLFYLANSYRDMGMFEQAIIYYKQRYQVGGWEEEVWSSKYQIGNCYFALDKKADAIFYWLEAYNHIPERVEVLYKITQYYRNKGQYQSSLLFCLKAMDILKLKLDNSKRLFCENEVYSHLIYVEYTIIAYYCNIRMIDNEVVSIMNACHSESVINQLLKNMKFYNQNLQPAKVIDFTSKLSHKIGDKTVIFNSSSASIILNPDDIGYLLNIRYVNYAIVDGNYIYDANVITLNKCITLDESFHTVKEHLFEADTTTNRCIMGVEDVKLFKDEETNQILFIGQTHHTNNKIGIVSDVYDLKRDLLELTEYNQTFANTGCEKNWVFVKYNNSTHIIYSWNPLKIGKLNPTTKLFDVICEKPTPRIFTRVRGSTPGYSFGNEIWFIVHVVSYETPRHYYHMLVIFDNNLENIHYSAPFKFQGLSIEYCVGLIVEESRVLISYSTMDNTTKLGFYNKSYLRSLVKYN